MSGKKRGSRPSASRKFKKQLGIVEEDTVEQYTLYPVEAK